MTWKPRDIAECDHWIRECENCCRENALMRLRHEAKSASLLCRIIGTAAEHRRKAASFGDREEYWRNARKHWEAQKALMLAIEEAAKEMLE